MTYVVGMIGKAKSGKDTTGAFLIDEGFTRVAFADPVKKMLSVIFPHINFDGDKTIIVEPYGITVRDLMIKLGHDWGRKMIGETLWIDIARKKIDKLHAMGRKVVVTDVRYHDEAELIMEYPRNDLVIVHRDSEGAGVSSGHITENADWTTFPCHIIENNSTLASLRSEILDIVNREI